MQRFTSEYFCINSYIKDVSCENSNVFYSELLINMGATGVAPMSVGSHGTLYDRQNVLSLLRQVLNFNGHL